MQKNSPRVDSNPRQSATQGLVHVAYPKRHGAVWDIAPWFSSTNDIGDAYSTLSHVIYGRAHCERDEKAG